ncbi:MAG: EAL domain-containing protein [Acidimicrobiia bacterium]
MAQRRVAEAAIEMRDDASIVVSASELRQAVTLQRGVLDAYLRMQAIGNPKLVGSTIGFDAVGRLKEFTALKDERAKELVTLLEQHSCDDRELRSGLAGLATLPDQAIAGTLTIDQLSKAAERLGVSLQQIHDEAAAAVQRANGNVAIGSAALVDSMAATTALFDYVGATAESVRLSAIALAGSDVPAGTVLDLARAVTRRAEATTRLKVFMPAANVDQIASLGDAEMAGQVNAIIDRTVEILGLREGAPTSTGERGLLSLTLARTGLTWLAGSSAVFDSVDGATRAAADELVSTTAAQARRSLVISSAVIALTLLLTFLTLRAVVRPLRRIGQRAGEIRDGSLHSPPLGPIGPAEIARLAETFDEMSVSLRLIEEQSRALADGRLDDPVLAATGPGDLGRLLQASVERLSTVTTRLHESEALATAIVANAADAIWTLDPQGRIVSANAAAESMIDRTSAEMVGRRFAELAAPDRPTFEALEAITASEVSLSGEIELSSSEGSRIPALVSTSRVDGDGTTLYTVFARDITERKDLEARLARQARRDALTDLPNRTAALERLGEALQRSKRSGNHPALLFIDIDGFKSVNDSFGHGAGDSVLIEISRRLTEEVRTTDLVARLGGDEFVVLLEDVPNERLVMELGERIVRIVETPVVQGDNWFAVSASVGVAFADDATTPLTLLREADQAMYRAKEKGKARVQLFDGELQARVEHRTETERALRRAISADELELYVQPVVHAGSGELWGAEGLVRWRRPGFGMLSPGEFIPIAEESWLIVEIGRQVIARACEMLEAWDRDGIDGRLAINVSGRHIIEGDLVQDLENALLSHSADPQRLKIELTESHMLADLDTAAEVLHRIRRMGISISIDDFGTGYSSLTYLRRLPIDTMKIDRSFVSNLEPDSTDTSILETLLALGEALDLEVVAEGVETRHQLARLEALGCDLVQGFLFAEPMPAGDFARWCERHRSQLPGVR